VVGGLTRERWIVFCCFSAAAGDAKATTDKLMASLRDALHL
jgi:hypothetical protein